jgi:hypothetical protein
MRTLLALLIAGVSLTGCAVVPYEPVYAAPPPPPVVVVRPFGYYGHGYYGGGPYWRRGWR